MIEVHNLTKSYGPIQALKDVSFSVAEGEIVGLLGPNGAGKTTIIKTLTGYLQPDEGSVQIDGLDVLTQTQAAQARIGSVGDRADVMLAGIKTLLFAPTQGLNRDLQILAKVDEKRRLVGQSPKEVQHSG